MLDFGEKSIGHIRWDTFENLSFVYFKIPLQRTEEIIYLLHMSGRSDRKTFHKISLQKLELKRSSGIIEDKFEPVF